MLRRAIFECDGPVAVRYPRGGEGRYREDGGNAAATALRGGRDVTILTYGVLVNQALDAAELLEKQGVRAGVVKLNRIAPLDYEDLAPALSGCECILAAEDCCGSGCVGQRVGGILAAGGGAPKKMLFKNLGRSFVPAGSVEELRRSRGLDAEGIAKAVLEGIR